MNQVAGLEQEITRSDQLRAKIVGGFFLLVAAILAIIETQHFRFTGGPLDFLSRVHYGLAAIVIGLLGLYEFAYQFGSALFIARGRLIPVPARFLNATIESSVATFLLVLLCQALPAAEALNLPPVFLYFPFLALATLRLDPWIAGYSGLVAGIEFVVLSWITLAPLARAEFAGAFVPQVGKAVIIAVTGGILAFVTHQVRGRVEHLLQSQEQQGRMAAIFGQHVSPAVMEKLLDQKAGSSSEVRHVTVLFLDIRNFTTFSESRTPDQVVTYLNKLFEFMVDTINAHNGIINKFLGDGFMAVFGAPLDDGRSEVNALQAALRISDRLAQCLKEGMETTRIGMGLHSGNAVTGNVGSAQRQEYTIIGDVVNLASRIESQTKVLGAEILVSATTWDAARLAWEGPLPPAAGLGPVLVKGREAAVELVRIR